MLGSVVELTSVIVDVFRIVDDVVESLSKIILFIVVDVVSVSLSRKTIVGRNDVDGSLSNVVSVELVKDVVGNVVCVALVTDVVDKLSEFVMLLLIPVEEVGLVAAVVCCGFPVVFVDGFPVDDDGLLLVVAGLLGLLVGLVVSAEIFADEFVVNVVDMVVISSLLIADVEGILEVVGLFVGFFVIIGFDSVVAGSSLWTGSDVEVF